MRLMALLLALALAGCAQPASEPSEADADRVARMASGPPVDVAVLAWDVVELDSVRPATVAFEVPPEVLRMAVLWQSDEGVFDAPVRWSLGVCSGQGVGNGVTVNMGRHNNSSGTACPPLPEGPAEATLTVPTGTVRGTFTVLAVVDNAPANETVTLVPPGP